MWLAGKAWGDSWPPEWRAQVAYVSQQPALPEGNVLDALALPFRLRVHRDKVFDRDRACHYLSRLGLDEDFLARDVSRLSGGEAQMVNLLRSVLIAPRVLLLDEPTASLDAKHTAHVETLVADWLAASPERACVWTSHDVAQLARVTGRRLILWENA